MTLGDEYLKVVQERFKEVKKLGDRTINQLSLEELQWKANDASNSIAIIAKHLSGNMVSRWTDFLNADGEKSSRNRDQEFIDEFISKREILKVWEGGWKVLFKSLSNLNIEDLQKTITIRGEELSVVEAIERQMAHYAYHVGQIVYIGKQVKNKDWKTLSIPKGKSEEYLQRMLNKDKPK